MKKFFSKLRNILCIFAALAGVLFISSAAVAQSLPDLTVTNATYTPANPNTSDEIILSITVRNQGKAIAENIFVSIFVDNEEFDYYFIPDLEPGESSTDEIELWDLTAGRRTIRVEIDPDNEISESNKKNNIHTFYMTVAQGPQPDLVITSATIEPPNPSATDQIILNITVKNQGAAPSDETELDVYVDGDLFDTCYIFDLDVGETQTEDVNLWYLPAGNHAIWIAVDPDNIVKESNENNNSYNLAMNVNFGFFNTKISGAIKDLETQKPVNGIIVQLDGGAFQTYTNAKGEFSIYGAAPGMHKLQVWGFAYNFQQFDIYVFDDKDTAIAEIAMTKLDGTVVGRIVDSQTGEPLAAATAQLDGGGVWRTLTDEQGYFMFLGVTPGAHTLQAWGYAYNFQEQPINVKETGATDVGSRGFTIIPDTIRGQIIDAGTGRPIMNAHVQFDGGGLGKETKTNITGRFILVNVPAGARQLQTWGWAYQFKQIDVAQNAGAATDAGQIGINPVGGTVNGRLL
ncbi:MAG TPA: CARDB domain-containing protein, partial [Candidatus Sumerlaeia bacterium]|nr:CARDB domain-containing protein [Candidatus Sumerlaeia bacterium]